jgi:anhydro-N-acetylmuramic acid kinase
MLALGLMSGTSMDGVDAALLRTDGAGRVERLAARSTAYDDAMREATRAAVADPDDATLVARVEADLTDRHAAAVAALLDAAGIAVGAVDVVGFHGQTILHDPAAGATRQIGDGRRLARATGCRVVNDFRSADMASGGEGAPLAPVYHAALAQRLDLPLCVLNVGGVANVTWIGATGGLDGGGVFDHLLAFDTGPGGALLDDWVSRRTGAAYDAGGMLARAGTVDEVALAKLLDHAYFGRPAPKSLDRNDFDPMPVADLSPADGAATLLAFTVGAVAAARVWLPGVPRRWLVTGGGRRNNALMAALAGRLSGDVAPVEAVGWDGDVLEAEAFAYLAVRRLRGLPASGPSTTGVARPVVGGVVIEPD